MAPRGLRGTGTPTAPGGTSAPDRAAADVPVARPLPAVARPARWALVALAAVLVVGIPGPYAVAAGATVTSVPTTSVPATSVPAQVEPPPAPAEDAGARAARLAALEAAVVAAETAAADLAAAQELTPRAAPVRIPDGDLQFTRVTTPGGATLRLRDDAPRGVRALVDTWPNGAIPGAALCPVPFAGTALLQCDAAEALVELDAAYHDEFGSHLVVNSAYRTFDTQVSLRFSKGGLAAVPGTSNHGWGLAVDLGGIGGLGQFDSPRYAWLKENAGRFGWHHPRAMEPGGGGPQEPWHWEFATS